MVGATTVFLHLSGGRAVTMACAVMSLLCCMLSRLVFFVMKLIVVWLLFFAVEVCESLWLLCNSSASWGWLFSKVP